MPYIPEAQREALLRWIPNGPLQGLPPATVGELNFVLTAHILDYLETEGRSYQTFNDITGALGEVAAEFRRRVIVPYEEAKIKENGDVYPLDLGRPSPKSHMFYCNRAGENHLDLCTENPPISCWGDGEFSGEGSL